MIQYVLPLNFNQIKKQNNTQLKCQFYLFRHDHGPNQTTETRAQLMQCCFHRSQAGLHIFFCKDQQ